MGGGILNPLLLHLLGMGAGTAAAPIAPDDRDVSGLAARNAGGSGLASRNASASGAASGGRAGGGRGPNP